MLAEASVTGNDYFTILFVRGGGIGYVLWTLSVVMVGLAIQAFLLFRRDALMPRMTLNQLAEMFQQRQFRQAIDFTAKEPSMFSYLIHSALLAAPQGAAAVERSLEDAAEEKTTQMLRRIEYLNLIGNIAPMLGLLGTVWGMIQAFFKIVEMGNISPASLADALGIKLVCTLVGLVVAIPALTVYGIMRNRIDGLASDTLVEAQKLAAELRIIRPAAPAGHPAAPQGHPSVPPSTQPAQPGQQ